MDKVLREELAKGAEDTELFAGRIMLELASMGILAENCRLKDMCEAVMLAQEFVKLRRGHGGIRLANPDGPKAVEMLDEMAGALTSLVAALYAENMSVSRETMASIRHARALQQRYKGEGM